MLASLRHIIESYQSCSNRYTDSLKRFQHVLDASGVTKSLKKLGVKEGDTVIVGEVQRLILLSIKPRSNDLLL